MSNLTLTLSEERKNKADELKQARNYRYVLNSYTQQQKAEQEAETVAQLKAEQEQKEAQNQGFFVRALATVGDFIGNVFTGAAKGVEGVFDLGTGMVGAIGGIFDSDFQEQVKNFIATDYVGDYIGKPIQELTKDSYLNDGWLGETIENVASGVGQMLPALPMGPVGLPYMVASAAGQSTEQAFKEEGTNYYRGLGYGLASGAVEGLTEKMFGGLTKNVFGNGFLDTLSSKATQTGFNKFIRGVAQEGVEEVAYELVDPLLKNIYKDKGFFEDFMTSEHLQNMGQAFAVGSLTGLVWGETMGRINRTAVNIDENIRDLQGLAKKENNLWSKDDDSQSDKINSIRQQIYKNISNELTPLKPEARQKFLSKLKEYGLGSFFNEDGTLAINENSSIKYNKKAYSPNLARQELELLYAPTQTSLSDNAKEAKSFLTTINPNARIVITDSLDPRANALYDPNTKILYLSNSATTIEVAGHELTHTLEGTKAYKKLADYVLSRVDNLDARIAEKIEQYKKHNTEQKSGEYGKQVALYEAQTEIVADEMGKFLTDKTSVERIVNENKSLAYRIWQWIKDAIAKLTKRGRNKTYYNFMRNVEKLYSDAIRNSVGGITLTDVSKAIAQFEKEGKLALEQENNGVDNNKDLRYSKKTIKYISYDKLGKDTVNFIQRELERLFDAVQDGIANNVAIEKDGIVYVLDAGKDNGDIKFGVREKYHIESESLRKEFVRRTNYESVSKGYCSDGLSSKLGVEYVDNRARNRGQELGEELSINSEQSENNKGRVFEGDEYRRDRGLRASLNPTDSQGNTLTPAQQEFFKDSKIRDDNGNLLVVYHGTGAEFYTFELSKSGKSNGVESHIGLWFTPNKDTADYFAGFNANELLGEKPRVITSYLNIKNPKIYDLNIDNTKPEVEKINAEISELKNKLDELPNVIGNILGVDPNNSQVKEFIQNAERYQLFNAINFIKSKISENDVDEIYRVFRERTQTQKLIEEKQTRLKQLEDNEPYYQMKDDMDEFATWLFYPNKNYERGFGRNSYAMERPEIVARNFRNSLIEKGFDGIILKNTRMDDSGDQYIAFEPNQIKLTTNENPTENEDIRYSLKLDSEGNRLTEQQASYFENSKIRNQKGQLLVAYHGTDANFNEFKNKPAQYGRAICDGFYFTLRKSNAEKYGKNVKEVYLNIEKPFYLHNGNGLIAELSDRDYTISRLVKEFNAETDDTGLPTPKALKKVLEKLGYDGVVSDTIDGDTDIIDTTYSETQIVAFKSNQIKYIYNDNPTNSKDLRYSLAVDKIDTYTKKQYNDFGWVRANDVVSANQWNDFNTKFGNPTQQIKEHKTPNGEFIIPVNDLSGEKFGINNTLIFAKGTYQNPIVTKIIFIHLDNETDIDNIRRIIYANERRGIFTSPGEYVNIYTRVNFQDYEHYKDNTSRRIFGNSNKETTRGRTGETTGRFSLKDNSITDLIFDVAEEEKNSTKQQKNKQQEVVQVRQQSREQIAKFAASHSKKKVYSKTDAEETINAILENQLNFGEKYGELSGKTKEQVVDKLWLAFNMNQEQGYRTGVAMDVADYIIENTAIEHVYDIDALAPDFYVVEILKPYLHNVDLSGIKSEIQHRYDKDKSPYLIWGVKKGERGQSPDQIAQELEEQGFRFKSDNSADIFFEMSDRYREARSNIRKKAKEKMDAIFSKEDLHDIQQKIVSEILRAYDAKGEKTKFAQVIEHYSDKINSLKKALRDVKRYNNAKQNLVATIGRLSNLFDKNKPAGWDIPEIVVKFIRDIAKVKTWKDNISKDARESLRALKNFLPNILDETQQSMYPYLDVLNEIIEGKDNLTTDEMIQLDRVFKQFEWLAKHYDKVIFDEKEQSINEISAKGVSESLQAQSILKHENSKLSKLLNYVYTNPKDRIEALGLYNEDSVISKLYKDMLAGDRKRAQFNKDSNDLFEEFLTKNKYYLDELQKPVNVGDVKLTKGQAMSLYATSLREQGRSHIFNISSKEGFVHVLDSGLASQGKFDEAFAKGQKQVRVDYKFLRDMANQFTENDKKFLDLSKKFFNEISKNAKKDTDIKLYGITNVEENYYYPIKVSSDVIYQEGGKKNPHINEYVLEMGMNKSTKPNAKNKIVIDSIENVIADHIRKMSVYYGYAVPLTAYNRIMNRNNENVGKNMKSVLNEIDPKFWNYMNNLWQDMQGMKRKDDNALSEAFSFIRWAGASSALGLNPKVLVTQTLSLNSALCVFSAKNVGKGMAHFFGEKHKKELAKYSPLMWERMQLGHSVDVTEIREHGKQLGGGKIKKFVAKSKRIINAITTKPISWMDSNAIQTLWFASQYEVAERKGKGYEFGTEANKIEAGKLLEEAILTTQQTSEALGRSAWMRSDSEFIKFARMFTGDVTQLIGRVVNAFKKFGVALRMSKSKKVSLAEQGKALLGIARKELLKNLAVLFNNMLLIICIGMLFKLIKGNKDDDETWGEVALKEAKANALGLLPAGGLISNLSNGYEPTNMAYDALSDIYDMLDFLKSDFINIVTNTYEDETKRRAQLRNMCINLAKLTGIPLRNIETYVFGIVGKISPSTKEAYDALFKTKSNTYYLDKIQKATENGDEKTANTLINIMFDSRTGKIKDDTVLETTRDLIEQGYDVLPKSVSKTITYNNETYTLTSRQHYNFLKVYSHSSESIKTMVNSSLFKTVTPEAQAKSMKFVYDYYYDLAIEDLLGESLEEKNLLFAQAIPIEQLAVIISQAKLLTADMDKQGKTISNSRKIKIQAFVQKLNLTAVQKYMIMGYLGYKNTNGESQVRAYIQRLNLTKEEKEALFSWCGY